MWREVAAEPNETPLDVTFLLATVHHGAQDDACDVYGHELAKIDFLNYNSKTGAIPGSPPK